VIQFLGFFALCAAVVAVHLYVWRRLIRDTTAPGRLRRALTAVFVVLMLLMVAALLVEADLDPELVRWYAWPGYLWLAAFFYLLLALLLLEIPRRVLLRRRRTNQQDPDGPQDMSRRFAIARGSAAVAGVVAVGLVGYGSAVALRGPTVKHVPVTLRRLDPRVSGFRIAMVNDIHLAPILDRAFTQNIVDLINAERPDAVVVVGDVVDGSVTQLAPMTEPLRNLRSTHGSYFVTGNHEYYSGYREWIDHLTGLGMHPLLNEHVVIEHNGGGFALAGVYDATAGQFGRPPNVSRAVAGVDPGQAVVLLAHQPVQVEQAAAAGVDLQLSGHTHGGQMAPFHLAVLAQQGVVAGLHRHGDTQLYVSRGAGFWGPPVRVGAPPDITVIELRSEG
jgi:predicted MPP superfamily phosphohydrolase